jgi:hypothetical protein
MPTDHIRYDLLVQEALRSVVRKVLSDAARNGLPGDHHFYISFKTHAPGSERLISMSIYRHSRLATANPT